MITIPRIYIFILFFIYANKSNAQLSIGVDVGISSNKLEFQNNSLDIVLEENHGYTISVNLSSGLSKTFALEASPSLTQKNYAINNKNNISQNVNNSYLILPISLKHTIKLARIWTVSTSLGCYYGYWLKSNVDGAVPNVFELTGNLGNEETIKLHNIKYSYSFNSDYDQRNEFGWASKLSLAYRIKEKISALVNVQYYQSLTDQQKGNTELHSPKYNQTRGLTLGLMYHLN